MNLNRQLSFFAVAALLAGCAANVDAPKADVAADLAFDDTDTPADSRTRRLNINGTITYGETVEGAFAEEGFVGYLFTAGAGASISIDLTSEDADPVVYLYGPQTGRSWNRATSIAHNDDGGEGLNSHLERRLRNAGTYLILVREYSQSEGSFALTLNCAGDSCRQECGADDSCSTGSECHRVVCVRAPCPSFCEPIFTPPAQACGTRGAGPCAEGQFCNFGDSQGCGATDLGGVCEVIPEGCTKELFPVCGCDNVTYQNACMARRAGVSVASTGECVPPVVACGGRAGNTCADDEYCAMSVDDICGWADAQGTCQHRPEACIALYRPVCGCDNVTYSNSCHAAGAGVSVQHEGPCTPPDCRETGCEEGSSCQGCRGPSGAAWFCVPEGAVC